MPGAARGAAGKGNDRQRLKLLELLLDVSRRVAKFGTLDEVLHGLIEITVAELGAERGSLFLNDPATGELYSRVVKGKLRRELRLLNNTGVAGHVFTGGEPLIVHDAYADARFNKAIDEQTGFRTRSILAVPVRTVTGEVIGVVEALNKKKGRFTRRDLELLEAMTAQGALALQGAQVIERMQQIRAQEREFVEVVSEVTADIKLGSLLQRVMGEATRMLNAERSTLFLNDDKTRELWSEVSQGLESMQIRLPNNVGIAGAVFSTGKSINIPYAYADLRFNPAFDQKTGYFTRSVLCVPIVNKQGRTIGVTQVLNKHGGPFSEEDETRLRAFTAQISIALENAKLFADVQNMKNYSDSMLESMSTGVITLDDAGRIATCNAAGLRILQVRADDIVGQAAAAFFTGDNAWVLDKLKRVAERGEIDVSVDAALAVRTDRISTNLTVLPLLSAEAKRLGSMLLIEDISNEKRLKSTMARYMDPGIADQLLASGAEALGGQALVATVLFSDIRNFTTFSEQLGPQATVAFLNEYFELMVECIQREGGMLDKFIGDAIMAGFGVPVPREDDVDRAVRAAIAMLRALRAWNERRAAEAKPPVDIGIGLNTDQVVSGNIGSKKRMDYTMIGDGVNLASRLESACKQYGAHLLVSEFTYERLRGTYRARKLDRIVVKGKTQPVAIYEILEHHGESSYPNLAEALGIFRDAMRHYRQREFAAAAGLFEKVVAINPQDRAAALYVERCARLGANPPPSDWDGVWRLEAK
ncbi:MAG: adenylate/guanylate cyclase domain-containing protein [Betaproteobacteria bacterium]|nr:MAG: adenylate/guanylate cyclase domain-containing protein [Betaproteobacteria bacterium]